MTDDVVICAVGVDMIGRTTVGLYELEEEYALEAAERGHHYFYHPADDLVWLEDYKELRMQALEEWIRLQQPPRRKKTGPFKLLRRLTGL